MERVVLVVDSDAARRNALCDVLAAAGQPYSAAPDLFQGMASLGRANFGALVVGESRLQSLRGLCRLARKRHATIHLLVLLKPDTRAELVRQAVGLTVDCVPAQTTTPAVGARVMRALAGPAPIDFDVLNTGLVQVDVQMALDLESAHAAAEDDGDVFSEAPAGAGASAPPSEPPPEDEPGQLEGTLEDGSGAALLMGLFSQEVTGKLTVDTGPARGDLYFLAGEPAWALLPGGDAALWTRLENARALAPGTRRPDAPEGLLVGELIRTRGMEAEAARKFGHTLIRERLMVLTTQKTGAWRFVDGDAFRQKYPLGKVNPFSAILDTCRAALTPDQLLVVGAEMEKRYLIPGPALAAASPKLTSFTRGANVSALVDGMSTVSAFYEKTGLDLLMGALVVMVLLEARLVSLADEPVHAGQVALQTRVGR